MILSCTWGKIQCFLSGLQALNNLAPPAIFLCDHIPYYFALGWFPSTISASFISSCKPVLLPLQGHDLIWPLYLESSSHSNCMVNFFIFCRSLFKHEPLTRSFLATLSQMRTPSLTASPSLCFSLMFSCLSIQHHLMCCIHYLFVLILLSNQNTSFIITKIFWFYFQNVIPAPKTLPGILNTQNEVYNVFLVLFK